MTCAACLTAAGCAAHRHTDPFAIIRAFIASHWRVDMLPGLTEGTVHATGPHGERVTAKGATIDAALAKAWRLALIEAPGLVVAGRMAGVP